MASWRSCPGPNSCHELNRVTEGLVYIGQSKESEGSVSPETQETTCRKVAAVAGCDSAVVYRDPGISGGKPPEKRPGFMALRDRIASTDKTHERLSRQIKALVEQTAPELADLFGVAAEIAGQFLVTVGDNPDRIRSEAAFAKLGAAAPQPASSGQSRGRHRLSRSGDRAANSARYMVAIVRLRHHAPTRAYYARRSAEGLSKREIIRCLKRYIAREVFAALPRNHPASDVLNAA